MAGSDLSSVPLVDEPQAAQRQQRLDLVDRLAVRGDRVRQPAGRDHVGVARQAPCRDAAVIPSTRPGEAVGEPGLDRGDGVLADRRAAGLRRRSGGASPSASVSASSEISTPGPITPPRYSTVLGDDVEVGRRAEVDRDAGAVDPVVRGDRVDQAVGPQLMRVLDRIGMPVFRPGPTFRIGHRSWRSAGRGTAGRAGEPRSRRSPRRSTSKSSPSSEAGCERGGELVGGRVGVSGEAPVVGEVVAVEGADVGLGVPDVNRERAWAGYDARRGDRPALRDPWLPPLARGGADARAKGIPYKRVDLMPGRSKGVRRAPASRRHRPGAEGRRREGPGLPRDRRALDEIRPDPPLFPPTPPSAAKVEEAERWGDEVLQPMPRRIVVVGAEAKPRADGDLLGGREARVPVGARGQDRRHGGRAVGRDQRLDRRGRARRPRRRSRAPRQWTTLDRRRDARRRSAQRRRPADRHEPRGC